MSVPQVSQAVNSLPCLEPLSVAITRTRYKSPRLRALIEPMHFHDLRAENT
jgi:hypothetical protein